MREDWPNRSASRFVRAGALRWHVQILGTGPPLLLLHGTGSSTHSWRDLAPYLAERFRVIAPDLPGHGFTSAPELSGFTLPAMAASIRELLEELGILPAIAVGHSAGAAILVRMTLDGYIQPRLLVSLNGALLPLAGFPRWLFAPLARLGARSDLIARLVARRGANPSAVERLIEGTGSHLDQTGIELYRYLFQRPAHVTAALSMMAGWDLRALALEFPRLKVPLKLFVAKGDRTIPPAEATRVRLLAPQACIVAFEDGGHLLHEEHPRRVADEILRLAIEADLLGTASPFHGGPKWLPHPMQL